MLREFVKKVISKLAILASTAGETDKACVR